MCRQDGRQDRSQDGRVSWAGAPNACSGWVQWTGALCGCAGWIRALVLSHGEVWDRRTARRSLVTQRRHMGRSWPHEQTVLHLYSIRLDVDTGHLGRMCGRRPSRCRWCTDTGTARPLQHTTGVRERLGN